MRDKQTTAVQRLEARQRVMRLLVNRGTAENELGKPSVKKSIRILIRELGENGVAEVERRLSKIKK